MRHTGLKARSDVSKLKSWCERAVAVHRLPPETLIPPSHPKHPHKQHRASRHHHYHYSTKYNKIGGGGASLIALCPVIAVWGPAKCYQPPSPKCYQPPPACGTNLLSGSKLVRSSKFDIRQFRTSNHPKLVEWLSGGVWYHPGESATRHDKYVCHGWNHLGWLVVGCLWN